MNNKGLVLSDVPYGNHERQKLDIFIPSEVSFASGLILFIHGGGWVEGDKSAHRDDAEFFFENGCIAASMNYRYVSDELTVFDELDDITAALRTLRIKCAEYGFCVDKVIVSGGSAGAHLSLLYACTRLEEAPLKPVAACVFCPPTNCAASDFLLGISGEFESWKYEVISKCCGCKITKETFTHGTQQQILAEISPLSYVSQYSLPTAVFHGRYDELVPLEHSRTFLDLLGRAGVRTDFLLYENSGHALDKDPEAKLAAKAIITDYIKAYLI